MLSSVIATILHLFLWIVVWLFLTVKQSWTFKLRVTVGRAAVRYSSYYTTGCSICSWTGLG